MGCCFVQAEDGIRDADVTGVQTCALPIFWSVCIHPKNPRVIYAGATPPGVYRSDDGGDTWRKMADPGLPRSEERRVGKEWRSRSGRSPKKRKNRARSTHTMCWQRLTAEAT